MRKRFRVLLLAGLVAAFVVPVGFALSLESQPVALRGASRAAAATTATAAVASSVVLAATPVHVSTSSSSSVDRFVVPDAAKLLIVGTMLFGLAAAVRKAI